MKTYTLKSAIRRGSLLSAAFALVVATFVPFASIHADELNPLTDRSLTLSSGSPGWAFSDGSGNSTYAPPNSGTNGQKTGNTFEFKVSSATPIKAMTFQYCTESAGICMGPGDIPFTGTAPQTRESNANSIASKKSDLEVVVAGGAGTSEADFGTYVNATGAKNGKVNSIPAATTTGSNFMVYYRSSDNGTPANLADDTWAASTGWSMAATEEQDATVSGDGAGTVADGTSTGKANQITLSNSAGNLNIPAGTIVKVVFFGTNTNYITNPGSDAFFVKINTFSDDDATTKIDGGVTVANVMNESIQITTKVLETMDFSVGTVDPFTLAATGDNTSQLYAANGRTTHVPCEPILKGLTPSSPQNTLDLGDQGAEFSLKTTKTYSTHSYWRLSSNSSAGATVYYSGVTLSNTVGDKIDPIYRTTPGDGRSASPKLGMEQFGIALANGDGSDIDAGASVGHAVDYTVERGTVENLENGADNATGGIHASVTDPSISNLNANASYHAPQLYPLLPEADYGDGAGVVNANYAPTSTPVTSTVDTNFAFDENSNTVPVPLASQDSQVVDCVTGKMRYIANIAATTPAGIYTTKINYIAAPQY